MSTLRLILVIVFTIKSVIPACLARIKTHNHGIKSLIQYDAPGLVCPEYPLPNIFSQPCRTNTDCIFGYLCCNTNGQMLCQQGVSEMLRDVTIGEEMVCPQHHVTTLFNKECTAHSDCNFGFLCCDDQGTKTCNQAVPKSQANVFDELQCPKSSIYSFFNQKCQKREDCSFGYLCCAVDSGEKLCVLGIPKQIAAVTEERVRKCPSQLSLTSMFNRKCISWEDCMFGYLCCGPPGKKQCEEGVFEEQKPLQTFQNPSLERHVCPDTPPKLGLKKRCRTSKDCFFGDFCCSNSADQKKYCLQGVIKSN